MINEIPQIKPCHSPIKNPAGSSKVNRSFPGAQDESTITTNSNAAGRNIFFAFFISVTVLVRPLNIQFFFKEKYFLGFLTITYIDRLKNTDDSKTGIFCCFGIIFISIEQNRIGCVFYNESK